MLVGGNCLLVKYEVIVGKAVVLVEEGYLESFFLFAVDDRSFVRTLCIFQD